MVNTHQRMMKSFVNNYKMHKLASKEAGMAGSEVLDCNEEQVEDIKRLITFMDEEYADLVALSGAVKKLDELLISHISGESIEKLYAQIPASLKGYIELFFDMGHRPSYRLLESLLYKSPYYKRHLQSVAFGLLSKVDERPFVLSTPRLADDDHLHVDREFDSPILDKLFQMRVAPQCESVIEEIFSRVPSKGGVNYRELFTTQSPKKNHQSLRSEMRFNYTGHAGFLVETRDLNILIDPVIASQGAE